MSDRRLYSHYYYYYYLTCPPGANVTVPDDTPVQIPGGRPGRAVPASPPAAQRCHNDGLDRSSGIMIHVAVIVGGTEGNAPTVHGPSERSARGEVWAGVGSQWGIAVVT